MDACELKSDRNGLSLSRSFTSAGLNMVSGYLSHSTQKLQMRCGGCRIQHNKTDDMNVAFARSCEHARLN